MNQTIQKPNNYYITKRMELLMFNKIKNALSEGKDKTLSLGVKQAINYKLKDIGEMRHFTLDSQKRTIELEIMLDGEKEPLHVNVQHYEITQVGEKHYLVAKDITTSRRWINVMAAQYLSGQKFEIPSEYAAMLKLVV